MLSPTVLLLNIFRCIQYINQQNASNTIQEDTNHKTQCMLSVNSYMFWHQSAILREFNEPFVVIK